GGTYHVTDAEGQRLPPYYYLIADERRERPCFIFPPCIAELIRVVEAVHHVAEARMVWSVIELIIRAVERIRRLVHEPSAGKERVVLVETVIPVNLKERARNRQVIAAQCVPFQRGRVLPHPERLAAVARDMQATEPACFRARRYAGFCLRCSSGCLRQKVG